MEGVDGVVVCKVPFGQEVEQVEGIGVDQRPAEQLARDLGEPEAGAQLSAQVCGQDNQPKGDHLHGDFRGLEDGFGLHS